MKRQIVEYPLWWRLTPESQVKLIKYHYETYGYWPEIPGYPGVSKAAWIASWDEVEPELERLMKQPPRAEGRGGY